ncbi:MAG: hypothetical protein K8R41_08425 [Bacteroidales bacterium]|nr:hypothetical protein [Bacteroidales bacterium]
MKKIIQIIFVAIIAGSCNLSQTSDPDNAIARVYNDYLYSSELKDLFSKDVPIKDSLILVKNYINNWVKQKLIIKQAEKNLSYEQKDFSDQLESYRNSLIIYKYETLLLNQKLDTIVSEQEIENYYNSNSEIFKLKNDIVKVNYIVLDNNFTDIKKIKHFINMDEIFAKDSLEMYCKKNAAEYYLDDEYWMFFDELLLNIPIKSYNYEEFLNNNKYLEFENSSLKYFVKFIDFKTKESVPPLSFESNNIKSIIINQRKTELINKLEKEIFNNAIDNNDIEIY